jgi:APA family basic amino acid/polyamine antiporter
VGLLFGPTVSGLPRQRSQSTAKVDKTISTKAQSQAHLARRLGLFDATMIVMGGIIGAGIFTNPYVVAQKVQTPFLIL